MLSFSMTMFFDCNVISPEAAIELSLRWALALDEFVTRRLDTVTELPNRIVSVACNVRLPAFQLVLLSPVPPSDEASRNRSEEIVMLSGSIKTEPATPLLAAADKVPPASSTVPMAENSTKPPSPETPPSARICDPAIKVAVSSAKMMTLPPSEFVP